MNNENELIQRYIVSKATELINKGVPVTQEQLNRAINMFVGNGKSFAENKPDIDKLIAQHIENHKKRLTENKPNNDLESMLKEEPVTEAKQLSDNKKPYIKKTPKDGNNIFGFAKSQSLSTTLLITAFILVTLIILYIVIK